MQTLVSARCRGWLQVTSPGSALGLRRQERQGSTARPEACRARLVSRVRAWEDASIERSAISGAGAEVMASPVSRVWGIA